MDPGARLGGNRYVVTALLGEGAQGSTYAATQAATGRAVAIKRFDVRGARSWKDVELAEREARVLATLDHPLVPRYIENFEEDGALYLVMDRVEGETLEVIRKREGALSEAEVRRFLVCAESALTYLHRRDAPVVHRDVKPSNVVRRADGSYVLVDFGAVSEQLFRRGSSTFVGTIGYMAPEQLQGRSLPASDVYAVGATALAALVGVDPETLPHKGLRVDVRAALKGRASPDLTLALERMLEPDPDLRAPSIAAALESAATVARGAERAGDDAVAKSLRSLLWALWGIGWVIVPLVFGEMLHQPKLIPLIMFGWLALNLIAGWHKSAVLRALVGQWRAENETLPVARKRVGVGPAPAVRVQAPGREGEEDEIVARAEGQRGDEPARRQRR
jgi:serine/threonine protein kinase